MNRTLNLLVIEDSESDFLLLLRALKRHGYTLDARRVDRREELVGALEKGHWDLVLSDYSMPEFNGLEALQITRSESPGTPFIFISGTIGEESAAQVMKDGAWDYVLKGNYDRAVIAVERALRESKIRAEEQAASAALLQSEFRFRTLAAAAPVGIFEADRTGAWTYINQWFPDVLSSEPEALVGAGWVDLLHPQDRTRVIQAWKDCVEQGRGFVMDHRFQPRAGSVTWVITRAAPLVDPSHRIAGFIGTVTDITPLKKAEQERLDSEERHKRLLDQSLVGFYLIQDGRFTYANPKLCEMLGCSPADFIATSVMDFIHEGDREKVRENIRKRIEGELHSLRYTLRMVRKDGGILQVEVFGARVDFDGQPAILGTMLDITQQRALESRLRQTQKLDSIGTLASGIAHDFNNILAAINGYTELARMEIQDRPDVIEHLDAISSAGRRAIDLVGQILTFSRKKEHSRKVIRLEPILQDALKLLRASIPASVSFKHRFDPAAPAILADENQIHQIIMNLGTNAWHALSEGRGEIEFRMEKVEVGPAVSGSTGGLPAGTYARIIVSDTGQGMTPETLARIFDPFFTTKDQGKGTGLGLAVVHGIMETHEGLITVDSQPGHGTRFELFFPEHQGTQFLNKPSDQVAPTGGRERVLFVDDELVLTRMGKVLLERLGYSVEVCTDPSEAIQMVNQDRERFDLVITDLTMPNMNGTDLARVLTKLRPNLPVILMSGYFSSVQADDLLEHGIQGLVQKPFSMEVFDREIRRVMRDFG